MVDVATLFAGCQRVCRRWFYLVKNDPEAVGKLRTFVLAMLVVVGVIYAGYTLFVEPQTKVLAAKAQRYQEVRNSSSAKVATILSEAYQNLRKQDQELQTKIGVLRVQNSSLKEMWKSVADQQAFAQAVLALLPSAPAELARGMSKLGQQTPEEEGNVTIFPAAIEGRSSYGQLLEYLQYLESRPEVGVLDKLTVSGPGRGNDGGPGEELSFQIRAGRIVVKEF